MLRKVFRQKVGMLVFRLDPRDLNISLLNKVSQDVVVDIYFLPSRCSSRG